MVTIDRDNAREVQVDVNHYFGVFKVEELPYVGPAPKNRKWPKPRSGHRCVCNQSHMFCFGGFNPTLTVNDPDMADDPYWEESIPLFKQLWVFNFSTKSWTKLPLEGAVPEGLASQTAALHGNNLIVYGGTAVPFGEKLSNRLHVCNLKTWKWQIVETTGKLPEELYGQAGVIYNNYFYTVGGTSGYRYSIDVHRLNIATCEWEHLESCDIPQERYRHEIGILNDKIYVFGGGTAEECYDFETIPVFDIKSRSWTAVQSHPDSRPGHGYPAARKAHSLVQDGNFVYICGGLWQKTVLSDVWTCDLTTLQWRKSAFKLPKPLYFHSACITPEGKMVVYGGAESLNLNSRCSDISYVWLRVPTLKEMVWEALLSFIPDIKIITKANLAEIGVPFDLIDRLS